VSFRRRSFVLSLVVVLISSACADRTDSTRERFEQYLAASNAHDLDALEAMTADDIVWKLGPWTLTGKEQVLRPHYSDSINHTVLVARDVVVRGDTVECVIVERNDATRAYGPDSLVHYARYVFKDGLVTKKEPWRRSNALSELNRHAQPFRSWLRSTHPEAMAVILDSTGTPRWTPEAADKVREMREVWVAAGKPGLE
jgi:ketosteroid isomerase-like protein